MTNTHFQRIRDNSASFIRGILRIPVCVLKKRSPAPEGCLTPFFYQSVSGSRRVPDSVFICKDVH